MLLFKIKHINPCELFNDNPQEQFVCVACVGFFCMHYFEVMLNPLIELFIRLYNNNRDRDQVMDCRNTERSSEVGRAMNNFNRDSSPEKRRTLGFERYVPVNRFAARR